MPGAGTSKQEQQSQQSYNSKTDPWAPAQPILQGILGGLSGQMGGAAPTSAENNALNTISGNAANAQSFAPQAMSLATDLMASPDRAAGAESYNPATAPGMADILKTIRGDVSDSINGMFAGAGRDLSGMHAQALGRGITQAEAPVLLNQYNQNFQNQGMLAGLDQQRFGNRAQGLDIGINGVPEAQNAGAMGILDSEQMRRQLPLSGLGGLLGLALPIAGMGGQTQGTGTSSAQGSATDSPFRQFAQLGSGMSNLFGGGNAAGNSLGMLGNAFKFFGGR